MLNDSTEGMPSAASTTMEGGSNEVPMAQTVDGATAPPKPLGEIPTKVSWRNEVERTLISLGHTIDQCKTQDIPNACADDDFELCELLAAKLKVWVNIHAGVTRMLDTLKKADSVQKFGRCIELKKEISATQEKLKTATAATDLAVLTHVQHQLDEALHSARCCNNRCYSTLLPAGLVLTNHCLPCQVCPGCDKVAASAAAAAASAAAEFRSQAYDNVGGIVGTAAMVVTVPVTIIVSLLSFGIVPTVVGSLVGHETNADGEVGAKGVEVMAAAPAWLFFGDKQQRRQAPKGSWARYYA
jgi:hypothetical protein